MIVDASRNEHGDTRALGEDLDQRIDEIAQAEEALLRAVNRARLSCPTGTTEHELFGMQLRGLQTAFTHQSNERHAWLQVARARRA